MNQRGSIAIQQRVAVTKFNANGKESALTGSNERENAGQRGRKGNQFK